MISYYHEPPIVPTPIPVVIDGVTPPVGPPFRLEIPFPGDPKSPEYLYYDELTTEEKLLFLHSFINDFFALSTIETLNEKERFLRSEIYSKYYWIKGLPFNIEDFNQSDPTFLLEEVAKLHGIELSTRLKNPKSSAHVATKNVYGTDLVLVNISGKKPKLAFLAIPTINSVLIPLNANSEMYFSGYVISYSEAFVQDPTNSIYYICTSGEVLKNGSFVFVLSKTEKLPQLKPKIFKENSFIVVVYADGTWGYLTPSFIP